jgi:serine protease
VTWTTNNAAVATVNGSGLVTAVAPGFAAITATLGGESRSAGVTVPTLQGTALSDNVGLTIASSAARGSIVLYRIFVPTGSTNLTVTLAGGTGDADIYVRRATPPTLSSFTCASENAANGEICSITNPAKGTWYIAVAVWDAYAGATLTANVTP